MVIHGDPGNGLPDRIPPTGRLPATTIGRLRRSAAPHGYSGLRGLLEDRSGGYPVSDSAVTAQFIDPRSLYETEVPLGTRVGVFSRYLVVDSGSQSLFHQVTEEISRCSPILDIGCGVGVPLLPVGPTVMDRTDVIAGDLSMRQLQTVAKNASRPGSSLLQFDATRLPFKEGSFGSAVARHMLYHVPDPRLAAAEAARVLRDDGIFVATTNSSNSRPELQDAHREAVAGLGGRLVERMSTVFDAEAGGEKLLGSFRQVNAASWSGVLAFPCVNEVLDYYRSTAYFKLAFDDVADRSRLAGRVAEILSRRFGSGPAPLTVSGAIFSCTEPIR